MTTGQKLLATAGVVSFGVAVAWWFRKPTQPPQPAAAAKTPSGTGSGQAAAATKSAAAPQGVPLPGQHSSAVSAGLEQAVDAVQGTAQGVADRLANPPLLAPSFQAAPPPAYPPPPELANPNAPGWSNPLPAMARPAAPPRVDRAAPPPQSRQWRTHKVVDGDTLSQLAARYLGSAGRFMEIFEANRAALNSADMLRIGTVLKIPPIEGGETPQPAAGASDLVPVPPGALGRR